MLVSGTKLLPEDNLFEELESRLKANITQLQVENQLDQRGEVECCYRHREGCWKC